MSQKDRSVRRIDERIDGLVTGGGQLIQQGEVNIAPPFIPTAPEPEDVTIGAQTLLRTTLVPKVAVQVTWTAPVNLLPEQYIIDYAEDVNFTSNLLAVSTTLTRVALEMKTNTQYWVRVRAVVRGIYSDYAYPSNYPTAALTTMDDTTAPADVTGVTSNWTTGDFELSWTNPSNSNFFDTRVRIYNTNGGTLYKEVYIPGSPSGVSRWVFTAADNKQVTGNNPLTTLYYTIYARSIAHVLSPTGVAASVTKSVPTKPTNLTTTWASDDGTFKEDVKITWDSVTGASEYRLTIDSVQKTVYAPFYEYPYGSNVAEHRPTLTSGKANLAYTVQALDTLGLISPGASGTATNIAPQASNTSLTVASGFSSLYAYAVHTSDIQDFHHYRWLLTSGNGAATIQNVVSFTPEITFDTLNGTYALSLYVYDKFGQVSNPVTTTGILLDGLTIEQLRSETSYTSSDPSDTQVFLNKLKDNILSGQTGSRYVGNSSWRWILAQRPLIDRYRTVTLGQGVFAVSGPIAYLGLSTDNTTYRWFSGPLVATGTTGQNTTLTEYATEALAKTNAFTVASMPGNRVDFPSVMEARYIYLGHTGLSSTSDYNFQEFYPRRLVQTDDLEAETIKGINIAANTITADRMSVTQLSAITANIGGLVIDTTGYLWQGTGTAASPTTGLKIYNSGGIGRLTLYSGGIAQVDMNTNGVLAFGNTTGILDSTGIRMITTAIYDDKQSYKFVNAAGAKVGYFQSKYSIGNTESTIASTSSVSGDITKATVLSRSNNSQATVYLRAGEASEVEDATVLVFYGGGAGANYVQFSNVGVGLGIANAATNTLYISSAGTNKKFLRINDTSASSDTLISLENSGNNIDSTSYWIRAQKSSTDSFYVRGDGVLYTLSTITADSSITSNAQGVKSTGTNAGLLFVDRTGSNTWQWYGTGDIARLYNGTRDTISINDDGSMSVVLTDAVTNTGATVLTLWHRTTGTAANNFGATTIYNLESDSGADRNAGYTSIAWATAADATRKGRFYFGVYDTAAREFLRGEASGSAAMIGFLGSAASAKLTVTGSRGGNAALASLLTHLATYGLITDSSSA